MSPFDLQIRLSLYLVGEIIVNSRPLLSGFGTSFTFGEELVNLEPQLLFGDVTFTDPDNNYDGGTLTLTGGVAGDEFSIQDTGTGTGEIGFDGTTITFEGVAIGTATTGRR